jgi:hypothetical protein
MRRGAVLARMRPAAAAGSSIREAHGHSLDACRPRYAALLWPDPSSRGSLDVSRCARTRCNAASDPRAGSCRTVGKRRSPSVDGAEVEERSQGVSRWMRRAEGSDGGRRECACGRCRTQPAGRGQGRHRRARTVIGLFQEGTRRQPCGSRWKGASGPLCVSLAGQRLDASIFGGGRTDRCCPSLARALRRRRARRRRCGGLLEPGIGPSSRYRTERPRPARPGSWREVRSSSNTASGTTVGHRG